MNDIMKGYSAAVISSVGMGLGLKKLFYSMTKNLKGGAAIMVNSVLTYIAVGTAGALNSYCMRMGELEKGIVVYDESMEEMGVSKIAARKAVLQTTMSRPVFSFPIFTIPGVGMYLLDKAGMIPTARVPKTILELSVITFALWLAPPLACSIFPQFAEVKSSDLEEEFRGKRNSKGEIVEKYIFNKGL
eukprot:CAMPEP_0202964776 /NCGR_PEP_ID=MMETSP1396-20130829/8873_1 /ASSEMBLY_ACC=CAM_ASM_000872 /TAXON_ID= /ORGANISM="Pseudokeronopsis sp., Strain Brazil" /LENGTH=187 /DNA_ID=CAMNT_0049687149 /DNA_START=500 /DNA_END=1063 /DNA_ORIENTATION=-